MPRGTFEDTEKEPSQSAPHPSRPALNRKEKQEAIVPSIVAAADDNTYVFVNCGYHAPTIYPRFRKITSLLSAR